MHSSLSHGIQCSPWVGQTVMPCKCTCLRLILLVLGGALLVSFLAFTFRRYLPFALVPVSHQLQSGAGSQSQDRAEELRVRAPDVDPGPQQQLSKGARGVVDRHAEELHAHASYADPGHTQQPQALQWGRAGFQNASGRGISQPTQGQSVVRGTLHAVRASPEGVNRRQRGQVANASATLQTPGPGWPSPRTGAPAQPAAVNPIPVDRNRASVQARLQWAAECLRLSGAYSALICRSSLTLMPYYPCPSGSYPCHTLTQPCVLFRVSPVPR